MIFISSRIYQSMVNHAPPVVCMTCLQNPLGFEKLSLFFSISCFSPATLAGAYKSTHVRLSVHSFVCKALFWELAHCFDSFKKVTELDFSEKDVKLFFWLSWKIKLCQKWKSILLVKLFVETECSGKIWFARYWAKTSKRQRMGSYGSCFITFLQMYIAYCILGLNVMGNSLTAIYIIHIIHIFHLKGY